MESYEENKEKKEKIRKILVDLFIILAVAGALLVAAGTCFIKNDVLVLTGIVLMVAAAIVILFTAKKPWKIIVNFFDWV